MKRAKLFEVSHLPGWLYDFDLFYITTVDVAFYLAQIEGLERVLELGCGTGRLGLPIAQSGHKFTGIDYSLSMLSTFEEKRKVQSEKTRERLALVCADVKNFALSIQFDAILFPFRSAECLLSDADLLSCLRQVRTHLRPNGRFVVTLSQRNPGFEASWVQGECLDWERAEFGATRSHIRRAIDRERQLLEVEIIYTFTRPALVRFSQHLKLRYFFVDQFRDLLRKAGLRPIVEMGFFDGRLVEVGPEMTFICEKY